MASFEKSIPIILLHEGGFTVDHAGATNYGISLRWLAGQGLIGDYDDDGDVDADDIRIMTKEQATELYREFWWDRHGYARIDDQTIATKVFDLAVNMGPSQAHKLLQRSLVKLGQSLRIDGIFGPRSAAATNSVPAQALLANLRALAGDFYMSLIDKNPNFAKYRSGWLRRAMA